MCNDIGQRRDTECRTSWSAYNGSGSVASAAPCDLQTSNCQSRRMLRHARFYRPSSLDRLKGLIIQRRMPQTYREPFLCTADHSGRLVADLGVSQRWPFRRASRFCRMLFAFAHYRDILAKHEDRSRRRRNHGRALVMPKTSRAPLMPPIIDVTAKGNGLTTFPGSGDDLRAVTLIDS